MPLTSRGLFRLPGTDADNAMTWLEPTRRCNVTCDACFVENDPGSPDGSRAQEYRLFGAPVRLLPRVPARDAPVTS